MKYVFYVAAGVALLFASCKPDPVEVPNTALITVNSPLEGQVFEHGDTVFIQGNVVATGMMHGLDIHIHNEATDSIFFDYALPQHGSVYTFSEQCINTVTDTTYLMLHVECELDDNGNVGSKIVNIQFNP